jgi:hypothetical protein
MFSPFALGHLQHQLRPVGLQAGGDQRRGGQVEPEHDAARKKVGLLVEPCVVGGHHALERVARRAFGHACAKEAEQAAKLLAPHRIARPAEGGHRRLEHLARRLRARRFGQCNRPGSPAAPGAAPVQGRR